MPSFPKNKNKTKGLFGHAGNSDKLNYVRMMSYNIRIIKASTRTFKYPAGFMLAVFLVIGTGIFWTSAIKFNTKTVEVFPTTYHLYSSAGSDWLNGEGVLQRDLEEDAVVDDFNSENSAFVDVENPVTKGEKNEEEEDTSFLNSKTIEVSNFSLDPILEKIKEKDDKATIDVSDLRLFISMASFPGTGQEDRIHIEANLPDKNMHSVGLLKQDTYYSNNLNDGYFMYSLESIFGDLGGVLTVDDIKRLSINITAISDTGEFTPVYLDAVWLEIDYRIAELSKNRPKVKLVKGENLDPKKRSFSSLEDPEFTFINPKLGLDEIKTRVEQGEAEIVEDKAQIIGKRNPVLELLKRNANKNKQEDGWGFDEEPPGYISPFKDKTEEQEEGSEEGGNASENEEQSQDEGVEENTNNANKEEEENTEEDIGTSSDTEEQVDSAGENNPEEGADANSGAVVPLEGAGEENPEPESSQDLDPNAQDQDPGAGGDESESTESNIEEDALSLLRVFFPDVAYAQAQPGTLEDIDLFLVNPNGERKEATASIIKTIENGEEVFDVSLSKQGTSFVPGDYIFEVELHTRESVVVLQQDFSWGVLAINTNKSIYTTNDKEAYLQMGVLNEEGHTICDADLELKILSPGFTVETLSTENGTIQYGEDCFGDNYIEMPDYYAYYNLPGEVGPYEMELTATTANGAHSITDTFTVKESVLFDVERTGPTRVFPVEPYEMSFRIEAMEDFSGDIIEYVPKGFKILSNRVYSINQDAENSELNLEFEIIEGVETKQLTWVNAELTQGDIIELSYTFDAPDVSPEFYLLGPLTFTHKQTAIGSRVIFKEARQWQIANDAVLSTILVDGNGAGPRNWASQAFGDIAESISSADGVEIAAATTNENRNASLDTSFTLGNTPTNFLSMDNISYNVLYRANTNVGDDTLVFGIRIVNGGTILAAADAGGTFQTVLSDVNSNWHTTLQGSGVVDFTYINTTANKTTWDGAEVELRSTHTQNMGPEDSWVVVDTVEFTGTYTSVISISGSSSVEGATVAVAVNSTRQTETATVTSGAWTVNNIPTPAAGDVITVWLDGEADSTESTAVTLYSGSGDVTGMQLDANVLSIGTTGVYADQSLTLTDLGLYDADSGSDGGDEDVMHTSNTGTLNVEASGNTYTAETIRIETGDTFTLGGAETLNTYNIENNGTLTSGGAGSFNISGSWTNNATFQSNTETVTFSGASTATIAGDGTAFHNITVTTAGKTILFTAGETFTVNGLLTITGTSNNEVIINSTDDVTPAKWFINHQGTESVTYADITNSGCSASSTPIDLTDGTSINGGNNDSCWQFAPYVPQSQNWQWFDDETNETPISSLAGENTAPSGVPSGNPIKLRLTINETGGWTASNVKFKVQFSTASDFSSGVNDAEEIGSCTGSSGWCYADGVDTDDDAITTRVLTDSTANGTHNESGTSSSTFDHQANTATEFEFTLQNSGAEANTTYFFRVWDSFNNAAVTPNTGETYPSVTTGGTTLTLTIGGLPSSTTTEGVTTDIGTSSTGIPFGEVSFGSDVKAAQRITIDTNAPSGYSLFMYQRTEFGSANGSVFDPVTGTNSSPTDWDPNGCSSTAASCYGYHTSDPVLSGGSTRFSLDDTYARFNTSPEEVAFSSISASNETHDIVYRLKATNMQEAGEYRTNIVYIIVPVF